MKPRPSNSRVKHGDPSCADYGCKRQECLEARRYKQKKNKLLRSTGRPGTVSPERAAAHIQRFRAAGLQDKDIKITLGLATNTFYRILRGLPLTRVTEQRILSVPVPSPTGRVISLATVPAVGTHRRLQALLWQGWPIGELEQRLGVHAGWITRTLREGKSVRMAVEVRVKSLYDGLWNVSAERSGVDPDLVLVTQQLALRAGFAGPLAWDDDTIDDPAAVPQTDAPLPVATEGGNVAARWLLGEAVILGRDDRREVLQHLFEWTNDTTEEIAVRLDMSPVAAAQQWERIKKRARGEGRRVWRRVYVPRERDLTRNEMGEAA